MTAPSDAWLAGARPRPDARLRLWCFPPAGSGAASYQPWTGALPDGVELCRVQLPGRESRFAEPAVERLEDLLPPLHDALRPLLDVPCAFFGHSMGALIAYELARRVRAEGGTMPLAFYASGHRAPHLPMRRPKWAELPRDELIAELIAIDGIPQELLGNDELLDLVLPTVRADLRLYEAYEHRQDEPLPCRLVALGGDDDALVNRDELEAWRQHTSGPSEIHVIPGNHFFVQHRRDDVLRLLRAELAALLEQPP